MVLSNGCGLRCFDRLLLVFIRRWCRLAVSHKQHCDRSILILTVVVNDWRHYRLVKTSSKRSKRCNPHPCDNIVRQTINKLSFQTTMNNIFHNNFIIIVYLAQTTIFLTWAQVLEGRPVTWLTLQSVLSLHLSFKKICTRRLKTWLADATCRTS